ncbi:MAG TPA: amidohydrolase family protein [Miltoncostaeaceae bacterium]|nr:amidohydrolase family protein [Miltoncostaeaceae bacterium]
MRLWGEEAAELERAGADLSALGRLEDGLAAEVAGLGGGVAAVDAHVHLGRDADAHRFEPAALLDELARWGIARAVCFAPNDPGADGQFAEANAAVLAAATGSGGRIVPFCRIDPSAPGAAAAMERAAVGGARGLKLHPVAQRFRPEDPAVAAAVRDATARGWPVTIHAGFGARPLAGPLCELLDAAPGARLVLAHAGRGDARAVAREVATRPGVMLDTSLAALADLVALPPERLLFGSDRPYGEHGTALLLVARAAECAGWSGDQVAAVLGGNAAALLDGAAP